MVPYKDIKGFFDWLREGFDSLFNPIPEAAADTGDGLDDMGDSLDDWGNAWDDFTTSIDDGAKDWGRQISRWADEQGKAFGEWTAQVGEDTKSWFEGASEWIANGWEWITNFGKVNEAFADTGKESEEAQGSLLDGFWSWVESIKVAIFGTQIATDAFNDTIITAGDKINTAADIATGHIFSGGAGVNKPGRDPAGDQVGGEAAGQAWDPLTGLLNLATGQNHPPGTVLGGAFGPPSDSTALYGTPKPDDVGHSNLLGEYSDTKFESSPGKFVDIYSGGTKVDPNSDEGKRIQSIYQAQHDAKIANAAQQATMAEVKSKVTTADAGKAYILAGGGEEGLSAVEYAKEHGLDMAKYADIVQMADALGLEGHPMIETAKEGLAAKIAMAETIMADRIAAGQTPSIQGDMLELFPNVEDSEFGWSDKKLEEFKKDNENRYISMYDALTKSGTAITQTTYSDPSTGGSGYVGGINVAPWLSGGDIGTTAHTLGPNEQYVMDPTSEPTPYPGGGGGIIKPGGKGHSWGDFGPGIGGTITVINPAAGPGGGSGVSFSSSGHSGSWSGGGFGAANQWGGIIDEPIIGVGQHTGKGWRLGESQHELVTPMSEVGKDGNIYSINIHVGSITKEADYEKLKPLIQRWILEASSRRGMV